jgi:hypothetical protein
LVQHPQWWDHSTRGQVLAMEASLTGQVKDQEWLILMSIVVTMESKA